MEKKMEKIKKDLKELFHDLAIVENEIFHKGPNKRLLMERKGTLKEIEELRALLSQMKKEEKKISAEIRFK